MKSVSNDYKEQLTTLGRQYKVLVTYTQNNQQVQLSNSELNIVTPHYEGDLLKSVMKQLDLDSNVDIPIGTEINCQFGLKTRRGVNIVESKWIDTRTDRYITTLRVEANLEPSTQYTISFVGVNGNVIYANENLFTTSPQINLNGNRQSVTLTTKDNISRSTASQYNSTGGWSIFKNSIVENNANSFNNVQIELGNQATEYEKFGEYDYIDYGNYIVYSSEKQEDLKSYKIVCYDKMLNAMKDYQALTTINLFNDTLRQGVTAYDTGVYGNSNIRITSTDWTDLQAGTYTINAKSTNNADLKVSNITFNTDNTFYNLSGVSGQWKTMPFTFTTPIPIKWKCNICFSNGANITPSQVENVMLEQNDETTEYQPYLQTSFPMSVKDYLTTLSYNLNIPLATQTFINDDTQISEEKYLDSDGNSLGYTYRDVLDELAQVTASTICINDDDELEVRYLNKTGQKNLIINSASVNYTYDKTNNTVVSYNLQVDDKVKTLPAGTKLTLSYYLKRVDDYTELTTDFKKNRFGMHGQINYTNTNSQSVTNYPFATYVTSNNQGSRVSMTWAIPDNCVTINTFSLPVQIGCRPSDTNDNIWIFKEPQLEIGDTATDYEVNDNLIINTTYLKETNVNFKEKYGPINSVVFSRSADSDLIYRKDDASITQNGLCEIKIKDNQILNGNDRDNFIDEVFNQLNGIEFYTNDFTSTGITILELCDKYNVKVDENIYPCVMLNDELNVTQGFEELIHTDKLEESVSDYKKADTTDRRINQAYIIVDKQNQTIEALTSRTNNIATQENNNKQELLNKFGDYAPNSRVDTIETNVREIQTDTYKRTEVNQILKGTFYDENNNQIVSEIVKTISGTFDENGMTYAKTNAKTSTTINEIGVRVNNTTSNEELLFAGYDDDISQTIVRTDNIVVRNYINIGTYSRLQDYETGTGVFDI